MNTNKLYTNKDLEGQNKEGLYKRKLNSIYVYAESSKSMDMLIKLYKEIISNIAMRDGVVWSSSALCNMARKDPNISCLDYTLVKELINLLCIDGVLLKKGAIACSEATYSFVLHIEKISEFNKAYDSMIEILEKRHIVCIKDIQAVFNNAKGSYFWAKIILDYLEWLGLGTHGADDNIIDF